MTTPRTSAVRISSIRGAVEVHRHHGPVRRLGGPQLPAPQAAQQVGHQAQTSVRVLEELAGGQEGQSAGPQLLPGRADLVPRGPAAGQVFRQLTGVDDPGALDKSPEGLLPGPLVEGAERGNFAAELRLVQGKIPVSSRVITPEARITGTFFAHKNIF